MVYTGYEVARERARASPGPTRRVELLMNQYRRRRRVGLLWGLIAVAAIYIALLSFLPTLTGRPLLDGTIGVVLGLYVCSQPAANAVDMLFFERSALRELTHAWSGVGWLILNLLTLGAGWLVLARGVVQLVAPVR